MGNAASLVEKWRSQTRKGFLDLCVLVILSQGGRSYGLDMMEKLGTAGIEVTEGTLYPLLARMSREGTLVATWTNPDSGHPRKYYNLSSLGTEALAAMREDFEEQIAAYRRL